MKDQNFLRQKNTFFFRGSKFFLSKKIFFVKKKNLENFQKFFFRKKNFFFKVTQKTNLGPMGYDRVKKTKQTVLLKFFEIRPKKWFIFENTRKNLHFSLLKYKGKNIKGKYKWKKYKGKKYKGKNIKGF